MYYKQKGLPVTILRIVGSVFMVGISSCLLLYGTGMWFSITEMNSIASIVSATFFYLLFIGGMATFVAYSLWMFPTILTSDKGLDLRLFFYTMHIDWKSIVRLQKRNHWLMIFFRSKGLLLNRLYGLLYAKVWDQPVVVFISTQEMVNSLKKT